MGVLRRLLPPMAGAAVLATLLFAVCAPRVHTIGPPPEAASGRGRSGTMMEGMESPPPSTRTEETSASVRGVLAEQKALDRTSALMRLCGLAPTLDAPGPYTVFAPSDEAFEKLRSPSYVELLEHENLPRLVAMMRGLVVTGSFPPEDLARGRELRTLDGRRVRVGTNAGGIVAGDASKVTQRVRAANGWVYRVDTVPEPRD